MPKDDDMDLKQIQKKHKTLWGTHGVLGLKNAARGIAWEFRLINGIFFLDVSLLLLILYLFFLNFFVSDNLILNYLNC